MGGWGGGGRLFEFEWEWKGGGVGAYSRLGAYSNKYGNYFFLAGRGEGQSRELTQSSKAHAHLVSFAAVIRVVTKETKCTLYVPKIFTTVRAGLSTNSWVGTSCIFMYRNINDHNDQLTLLSGVFCVDQGNNAETYQR